MVHRSVLIAVALLSSCGSPEAPGDAGADAAQPLDVAVVSPAMDLALPDLAPPGADAAGDPMAGWALYTIPIGAHSAMLTPGAGDNPLSGLVSGKGGRDFRF